MICPHTGPAYVDSGGRHINDGLVRAGVIPDPRKGRPRKDAA